MTRKPCLTVERRTDETHQARIYSLAGKLIGDQVCYDFLETVRDELDDGHPHVILEVAELDRVNSTGIGILASIFTSAQNHGGRVCLVNTPQRLKMLIDATGLGSFLRTCDSVDAAFS